jgi:hypothetical protein
MDFLGTKEASRHLFDVAAICFRKDSRLFLQGAKIGDHVVGRFRINAGSGLHLSPSFEYDLFQIGVALALHFLGSQLTHLYIQHLGNTILSFAGWPMTGRTLG